MSEFIVSARKYRPDTFESVVAQKSLTTTLKNAIHSERGHCGFETKVEILMIDDVFVKRSLSGKINEVELILQKMIEVRSSFVYPVQVNIRIV